VLDGGAHNGVEYLYTDRGSLFQRDDGSALETFTYDALGNLTRFERDGGPTIDYVIDAQGWRAGKLVNGSLQKQYVWADGLRIVAELDPSGAIASRFIYGGRANVPDLIAKLDGSTIRLYRVITDQLGSPVYVVNIANANDVMLDASYDEWGNVTTYTSSTGTWPIPFGFAGGLYDEDTGFVRFGARDYDPRIGRWTSKDPIGFGGGQANLYVYVANDPLSATDPEGKFIFLAVPAVYWVAAGGLAIVGTAYATGVLENPFPVLAKAGQSVWDSISQSNPPAYPGSDPTVAPGPGWEWLGRGPIGSKEGAWHNRELDQSLHPDLGHAPPIGAHWDWIDEDGGQWRLFEDGRCEPKE